MSHRFALGQSVTYFASMLEAATVSGRYTITEFMPADSSGEYQYTVQREKTGELRRVREAQLRPLPIAAPALQPPPRRHSRSGSNPSPSAPHADPDDKEA